jgi:hypothetical protein
VNTKLKGDIAESHVIAAFLKAGKTVLMPFGDRNRYDLALEQDGDFKRVQVKTGRMRGNSLQFSSCSVTSESGKVKHAHYKGQIDLFAVYDPETQKIYLVPVDLCHERDTKLLLKGSSRNQHKPLLASDFEFTCPVSSFGRARA